MRLSLLRDHLDVYRSYYIAALVVLVFGLAILRLSQERQRQAAVSAQWPEVSAKVLESQIEEIGFSDGSKISVRLLLAYHVDQIPFQTELYQAWYRYNSKDYRDLLAVGKSIPVRHDPADPKKVSLAALTGGD